MLLIQLRFITLASSSTAKNDKDKEDRPGIDTALGRQASTQQKSYSQTCT